MSTPPDSTAAPEVPRLMPLVRSAFAHFGRNLGAFARLSVLPIVLTFPLGVLLRLDWNYFLYLLTRVVDLPPLAFDVAWLLIRGPGPLIITGSLLLFPLTIFSLCWLRLLLSRNSRIAPLWSRTHWRYLRRLPWAFTGYFLLIGIASYISFTLTFGSMDDLLGFYTVLNLLPWRFADIPPMILSLIVLSRVGLGFPAIADGHGLTLKQSWRRTRGLTLRLTGALILAGALPYLALSVAQDAVLTAIDDQPDIPLSRLPLHEQLLWHVYSLPTLVGFFAFSALVLSVLTQVYSGRRLGDIPIQRTLETFD